MTKQETKRLALMMAVNCVRNTCIEKYHSAGKLDDKEMKAFNKQVVNRIYTFLDCLFGSRMSGKECKAFLEAMSEAASYTKQGWDEPEIDENLFGTGKHEIR